MFDAHAGAPAAEAGIAALTQRVRRDLELSAQAPRWWVPQQDGTDYEVLIVGGGHAGLSAAFALQRQRIARILVVDRNPRGGAGPWRSYARMHTLRSPKWMKGIELDVPSLSPRSWFEAKYGAGQWDAVTFVPRLDWAEYLDWYRDVLDLPVRCDTEVVAVHRPDQPDGPFRVELQQHGLRETVTARRIVFASGLEGAGAAQVPAIVSELPKRHWAHTSENIDFSALQGRTVAVLGGGSSGWDNAACALEAGATSVSLFMRRASVPTHNSLRWMEFAGFQDHFFDWTDAEKFEFAQLSGGMPQPPTQYGVWRCRDFAANFSLELGAPFESAALVDSDSGPRIRITTPKGTHDVDFIISATGYRTDLRLRPELAEFVDDIALWQDRYEPSRSTPTGVYPYLGGGFEFTPKDADRTPWISRLFHFSVGARASMGLAGHQLSGIAAGLKRLAWTISKDAFTEHAREFIEDFRRFEDREVWSFDRHHAELGWRPTTPLHAHEMPCGDGSLETDSEGIAHLSTEDKSNPAFTDPTLSGKSPVL